MAAWKNVSDRTWWREDPDEPGDTDYGAHAWVYGPNEILIDGGRSDGPGVVTVEDLEELIAIARHTGATDERG